MNYIWYYTIDRPIGIPKIEGYALSDQYSQRGWKPILADWMNLNYDGFPKKEEHKLPKELFLYIKTSKTEPLFDWFYLGNHMMAVSEKFYSYIYQQIGRQSEISELRIFNTKRLESKRKYYVFRICEFNDNLFDFHKGTAVIQEHLMNEYMLYPDMCLIDKNISKNIFVVKEFCYSFGLILTEESKRWIEYNLYKPEIHCLKKYPDVWNNEFII